MFLGPGEVMPDCNESTSFKVRVAGWLMADVRRHLFLLVWVCCVPVHVQYVLHLLGMSAAALEIAAGEGAEMCGTQRLADDEPIACLNEHALRSAALSVLFQQVAADCQKANERVRGASLLPGHWAEVRSLSYQTDLHGGARIVAREAVVAGEVLALISVDETSLEAVYFTAVDQARAFIAQHKSPYGRPNTLREGGDGAFAQRQNKHKGQACWVPVMNSGKTSVVIVDSDNENDKDDAHSRKQEVVILSDDSGDTCTHTTKRRRRVLEHNYEFIE